jgi:hypothetical protein
MMGVWMDGMDFMRKVSTTMAKGKRRVGITLLRKRDGVVRYSTPEVKEVFSGTAGTSGMRATPTWLLGPSHLLLVVLVLFLPCLDIRHG